MEIYEDFHITICPQLNNEVREGAGLKKFGKLLFDGYNSFDYDAEEEVVKAAAKE